MQLKPCLLIPSNIDVKLWSRWMGARRVATKASALWKLERLDQEDVIVMMRVINFSEGLLMAARPFLRVVYARSIVASFWGVDRRTNAPLGPFTPRRTLPLAARALKLQGPLFFHPHLLEPTGLLTSSLT
jgi:hypothetical protein